MAGGQYAMRVLIITSCTGEKVTDDADRLTLADFRRGPEHVRRREADLSHLMRTAEEMYTGEQHVRLMRGVRSLRTAPGASLNVDLRILSAGYGLIPGDRKIAPYECTFKGMKTADQRAWADVLGVPAAFREAVANEHDLGILLLGGDYLRACRLDANVAFGATTAAFSGSTVAANIPRAGNLVVVSLPLEATRTFACGNVGLKGELAARLLACLRDGTVTPAGVAEPGYDLLGRLQRAGR